MVWRAIVSLDVIKKAGWVGNDAREENGRVCVCMHFLKSGLDMFMFMDCVFARDGNGTEDTSGECDCTDTRTATSFGRDGIL